MSDDNVEQLKPGKSLSENAFARIFEQKKKDSKTAIDKQAKVVTDAYNIFRTEYTKLKDLEEEHKEIDEDKATIVNLGLE